MSEIAFAFLLDVVLLREPTTPLAALGSLLVSIPTPTLALTLTLTLTQTLALALA